MSTEVSTEPPRRAEVRGTRAVLRGSAVYSLAIVLQGVAQLLLLPVYTRAFTTAEYGDLGVAISVAQLATALLSFGLEVAVIRAYFDLRARPGEQRSAMATLGVATLVMPLVGAVFLSLIAVLALNGALAPSGYLVLAVFASALFVAATVLPAALLRAEDRLRDYLILFGVLIASNLALTALFVLVFGWGPAGSLLGTLVANALGLVAAAVVLPWPRPRNLDRKYLFAALAIGLPLVPHLVSGWALQLSDRAILGGIVAASEVGVYTLAVNLAVPVMMVMIAVSQAVHPSYGAALHDPRMRARLPELAQLQVLIACVVTAGVVLVGPVVVSAVIPKSFSEAADLLPWLALGYGLWGIYAIPMNAISLLSGRTTWVWTITLFTAALRIGGLYWLVPTYGIEAAAIGLPICNLVLVVGISLVASATKGAAVDYDWPHSARVVAATIALTLPVALLVGHESLLDAGVRLFVLALLPVAYVAGGGVTGDQRRRLVEALRSARLAISRRR